MLQASRDQNIEDVVERTCKRHIDAETGVARRRLLKKKPKKQAAQMLRRAVVGAQPPVSRTPCDSALCRSAGLCPGAVFSGLGGEQ